jgi:phosphoserine phosphatase
MALEGGWMEEEGLVIFDMDGTLLRLPVDRGRVNDGLRRLYKTESAVSPLLPTVRRLAGTNVEILHRALEIIGWEERVAVPRLEVVEGARELLGELKVRG